MAETGSRQPSLPKRFQPVVSTIDRPACHLWRVNLDDLRETDFSCLLNLLGDETVHRYHTFLRPERKRQFLIGRILLKHAIAGLTQLSFEQIGILEHPRHKPELAINGILNSSVSFSLSHSKKHIACAVSDTEIIGLDIEVTNMEKNTGEMAKLAFLPAEYQWLQSQAENKQHEMFYHLWTRKESLYKLSSNQSIKTDVNTSWNDNCLQNKNYFWKTWKEDSLQLIISLCGKRLQNTKTV